tara:strand:- start:2651 stop:2860 length:210 start_codon:yes stop_codon:yes gene_type:complete
MPIIKITHEFHKPQEDPKVDKASVIQALGNGDEALEILVDLINDDYTIEDLKNDFYAYFEPDDRGDINR